MNTKIKTITALACGVVACGLSQSARANLVSNGDFESTTSGVGELGYNTGLNGGWTYSSPNNSYDFIFNASSKDGSGNVWAPGQYNNPNLPAGPFNKGVGLYAPASTSPTGGNFLGVDPAFQNGPNNNGTGLLSETIHGLTVGATYTLSFYWAAAQQTGFNGATTEGWDFGLAPANASHPTAQTTADPNLYPLPNNGFSGWMQETYTYTATSTQEVLSFLAVGGPSQTQPPFDLLDGVCLTQNTVPDSSSTAGLLGLGVLAMGVAAGCRRFARA